MSLSLIFLKTCIPLYIFQICIYAWHHSGCMKPMHLDEFELDEYALRARVNALQLYRSQRSGYCTTSSSGVSRSVRFILLAMLTDAGHVGVLDYFD